jgi:hypothetical protein
MDFRAWQDNQRQKASRAEAISNTYFASRGRFYQRTKAGTRRVSLEEWIAVHAAKTPTIEA